MGGFTAMASVPTRVCCLNFGSGIGGCHPPIRQQSWDSRNQMPEPQSSRTRAYTPGPSQLCGERAERLPALPGTGGLLGSTEPRRDSPGSLTDAHHPATAGESF